MSFCLGEVLIGVFRVIDYCAGKNTCLRWGKNLHCMPCVDIDRYSCTYTSTYMYDSYT